MRLSEISHTVYVLKPGDHNAGVDGDSINTENLHHLAFYLQFATCTGDAILTIKSGATAGVKTTSETFAYRLGSAAQGTATADVFAAETSATTLTLTAATYTNKLLIVEVPIRGLTAAQPWVTLNLSSAASALNASIVAIAYPIRYAQAQPPTAIT